MGVFLLGLTWDTSLLLSSPSVQLGTVLGHPWTLSLSGAEGGEGFARRVSLLHVHVGDGEQGSTCVVHD